MVLSSNDVSWRLWFTGWISNSSGLIGVTRKSPTTETGRIIKITQLVNWLTIGRI